MKGEQDKELIRRRFSRHLDDYETEATVQRDIAVRLGESWEEHLPAELPRVLEIGCGTGFLTRQLLSRHRIGRLYLNDLVEEAPLRLKERLAVAFPAVEMVPLPGDVERLDWPEAPDAVAAASVVQWFDDLPGFFGRVAARLKKGGWLGFNLFGPANLVEIRTLTGQGLECPESDTVRKWLERDFEVRMLEESVIRPVFDSPLDVLHHLRRTGVTGTGTFRWSKTSLRVFEAEYRTRFVTESGRVSLTWDVIYVLCRKK